MSAVPKPKARTTKPQPEAAPRPTAAQVAHLAGDVILEKKGADLVVLDISDCSDLADYMVIGTGSNKRQVQAMGEEIRVRLKRAGMPPLSTSGFEHGWWVLLDLGDVIVHVMQDEARRYYDLDALWADAKVVRRGVETG